MNRTWKNEVFLCLPYCVNAPGWVTGEWIEVTATEASVSICTGSVVVAAAVVVVSRTVVVVDVAEVAGCCKVVVGATVVVDSTTVFVVEVSGASAVVVGVIVVVVSKTVVVVISSVVVFTNGVVVVCRSGTVVVGSTVVICTIVVDCPASDESCVHTNQLGCKSMRNHKTHTKKWSCIWRTTVITCGTSNCRFNNSEVTLCKNKDLNRKIGSAGYRNIIVLRVQLRLSWPTDVVWGDTFENVRFRNFDINHNTSDTKVGLNSLFGTTYTTIYLNPKFYQHWANIYGCTRVCTPCFKKKHPLILLAISWGIVVRF